MLFLVVHDTRRMMNKQSQTLLLELVELLPRRLRHRPFRLRRDVALLLRPSHVGAPLLPVPRPRRVAHVCVGANLLHHDVRHAHRLPDPALVQADGDGEVHPARRRFRGRTNDARDALIRGAVGEGRECDDRGALRGGEREVEDVELEAVRVAVDVRGGRRGRGRGGVVRDFRRRRVGVDGRVGEEDSAHRSALRADGVGGFN
mmetsp:Transcript_4759/g.19548  ORF Transcript_4759/g.19548 Transcript_4759/m.19548 type:complete len:203 (-) Transcript_4759:740-1348(-)